MNFEELRLHDKLLEGINAIGFKECTPIQAKAISPILEGRDILASAQTGTGKTAAFLLPIIHQIINEDADEFIKAMIIVPTRELAMQIDQQLEGLSYFTNVSSRAIYGGSDGASFTRERKALSEGADIVVCTPGRLIAHLAMGYVKVEGMEYLVLDEADRMLDMGFHDDIMKIISYLPKKRQNLLFSATMPKKIRELANKLLNDPIEIKIALAKPAENVSHVVVEINENQKLPLVKHLLEAKKLQSVLVFCSTKVSAKELNTTLKKAGFKAADIHSDLPQEERARVLREFRNRNINVMVATDILSRGIDVEDIELVINYDAPQDAEDYIHRIGRTARAKASGIAFTFITRKERRKLDAIERLLGKPVTRAKIPDEIKSIPHSSGEKRGAHKRENKRRGSKARRR